MSPNSQVRDTRRQELAARPALVTAIAVLELAAALWDGRIFLHWDKVVPVSLATLNVLMPAVMAITAIYAGVGLLQMRRGAWNVWMARHAWLGGLYLLSLPALSLYAYIPGVSALLLWRSCILVFSLAAGVYLYAIRGRFQSSSAR